MAFSEKILEGKFLYFKNGNQYSEEFFSVEREDKANGNYTFSSEILSRVTTGEFLKIYTDYELTFNMDPLNVRVKRSLGKSKSTERYFIDQKDKNVTYTFDGRNGYHDYEKIVNGKFHIATPSFCTSALMTLMRKIDPVQPTPYTILTSQNFWEYHAPFQENIIFIELKSHEPEIITINNNELSATLCHFYKDDRDSKTPATPTAFYISKHFSIPYKAVFADGIEVRVDTLKILEAREYKNMF